MNECTDEWRNDWNPVRYTQKDVWFTRLLLSCLFCLCTNALGLIHFLFKSQIKMICSDTKAGDGVILPASVLPLSTKLKASSSSHRGQAHKNPTRTQLRQFIKLAREPGASVSYGFIKTESGGEVRWRSGEVRREGEEEDEMKNELRQSSNDLMPSVIGFFCGAFWEREGRPIRSVRITDRCSSRWLLLPTIGFLSPDTVVFNRDKV